jgi:hypothetical protein
MNRRDKLVAYSDLRFLTGVEIGPDIPIVKKNNGNILYADDLSIEKNSEKNTRVTTILQMKIL